MKTRIDARSVALGILAGAATVFSMGALSPDREPPIKEYRVVTAHVLGGNFEKALNDAATEGWQLQESNPWPDRQAYAVLSRMKR